MPVLVLCELLGYASKDVGSLKTVLRQLVTTGIEWVGANEDRWGITSFLSYAEIKLGVCHYRFDEFLAEKLYQPEIYARINIGVLRHFESKYALALYENCARYRPKGQFPGLTPQWTLDDFRILMGVQGMPLFSGDTAFKRINERILRPAISEINKFADIIIQPKPIKEGRKVIGLQFEVKDNPQLSFGILTEPEEAQKVTDHPLLREMRERYHVPELLAAQWLQENGAERFREVMNMANSLAETGRLKNPIGFIRSCFEQGYVRGRGVEEIEAELNAEKTAKKKATQSRSSQRKRQERARTELENLYQAALSDSALEQLDQRSEEDQRALILEWANGAEGNFFRGRLKDIMEAKRGITSALLGAFLAKRWDLALKTPFAVWMASEGFAIDDFDGRVRIVKNGQPFTHVTDI